LDIAESVRCSAKMPPMGDKGILDFPMLLQLWDTQAGHMPGLTLSSLVLAPERWCVLGQGLPLGLKNLSRPY